MQSKGDRVKEQKENPENSIFCKAVCLIQFTKLYKQYSTLTFIWGDMVVEWVAFSSHNLRKLEK